MLIVRRMGQALLSLAVVAVFVFSLVRLTGDPAFFLLGMEAIPADYERVRRELGLDQPLTTQFAIYVQGLLQGDLGTSYRLNDVPVLDLIFQRLPATLTMGGAALALVLIVAVPLGIYSAYWRGGVVDKLARFWSAVGLSMPSFWLGLLLIMVFAVNLGILPSGGSGGFSYLILPAIALAVDPIARLTRLLRSSMIDEMESDHVKFLRIKGMPERLILWKHALRNSALTSLTFVGILAVSLLAGSVLVETVFVWPGIGRLLIESIHFRDFATVQGIVLFISAAFIFGTLVIDLLYMVLNPRLRQGGPR